jgi:AraC family transcriptional regulator, positive regulator of tynA and feaB
VGGWLRTVDTAAARVAHREQGWGHMLSALCLQLGRQPALALQMAPGWLEDQFGALLGAALEPSIPGAPEKAGQALHRRAVACMRERLDQPGWRATDLALDLGVSLRSLHRAFTDNGDTVTGRWRALRMEHACVLLSQPRLAGLAMSEIGRRCGYTDASHFARDFVRSMGQTPLRWARERHTG